jgi:phage terminase small subunit
MAKTDHYIEPGEEQSAYARLKPQYKKFVDKYLETFNGTQSAIYAGYKKTSASETAYEILNYPHIKRAISERSKMLSDGSAITIDRWIREVGRIAFLDLRQLFDESGEIKDPKDWDDDLASVIGSFEVGEVRSTKDGDDWVQERITKVKMLDKLQALEKLGKYFRLFSDLVEVDVSDKFKDAIRRAEEIALKYGGASDD